MAPSPRGKKRKSGAIIGSPPRANRKKTRSMRQASFNDAGDMASNARAAGTSPSAQNPDTHPTAPSVATNAGSSGAANSSVYGPPGSQKDIQRRQDGYEYSPIGNDEIRMLIVHGGAPGSDLYCTLMNRGIRPLDAHGRPKPILVDGKEVHLPPYEALSYSWQNQQPEFPLRIHIGNGVYRIHYITKNLRDALDMLREPIEPRYFWVDAVCMNQENLEEKSKQLPLMARIYSEASNVCVWLGLENVEENTSKAFALMEKMRVLRDFETLVENKTECQDWDAFMALMTRNWFSRRWVVQEITLASKATLHCGSWKISWNNFAEAVALFEVMIDRVKQKFARLGPHPDKYGDIRELSASRLVHVTGNMVAKNDDGQVVQKISSLEYLVSALTPFEAKTPHDIIYAVLSLAKDVSGSTATGNLEWTADHVPPELLERHEKPEDVLALLKRVFQHLRVEKFPVDYGKSFYEVCEDFLKFSTTQSNSLDIICRPWAPVPPDENERLPGFEQNWRLPSWIRTLADAPFGRDQYGHWDRKNANLLVGLPGQSPYKASGSYRRPWKFEVDQKEPLLTVEGFQLDVIQELEDTAQGGVIPSSWLRYGDLKGKQYRQHEDRSGIVSKVTESFWRTMVANKGPDGDAPPPHYAFLCEKTFTTVVEHGGDVMLGQIHDRSTNALQRAYIRRVQSVVWGRKLTRTKRILALVPKDTRIGDIIAIIFGVSVPVVLRRRVAGSRPPTSGDREEYDFIGECYAHGAMAGEAFDIRNELKKENVVTWDFENRKFHLR